MIKKRQAWKVILIVVLALAVVVVGLGLIFPGLIWQRPAGTPYTPADYESALDKLSFLSELEPGGPPVYVEADLTDAELTALYQGLVPAEAPLKEVQIRITEDATAEISSKVDLAYLLTEFSAGELTLEQLKEQQPLLRLVPDQANLNLKVSGGIKDNVADLELQSVAVQGIPVTGLLSQAGVDVEILNEALSQALTQSNSNEGTYINELTLAESQVQLKGTLPSSLGSLGQLLDEGPAEGD